MRAAWRFKQDIAIGRHLGDILAAENKPVAAMDVYTMSLALATGESAAKDPDAIAARSALAQLKLKGHAPTITDPRAALLALRTLNLGPAAKPHAAKPYDITLMASSLEASLPDFDGSEEPIEITDGRLLTGLFPPGSKAVLNLKATIQCGKTCTLIFTP